MSKRWDSITIADVHRLSTECFAVFSKLLLELHQADGAEELPKVIVAGLSPVITARHVVCRSVRADGSSRGLASTGGQSAPLASLYERFRHEDPLVHRRPGASREGAVAVSDIIDPEAWRASAFYRECCRPFGIEDQLIIECPSEPEGALHVVLGEGKFGRFDPADRWILELLRPHLIGILGRPAPNSAGEAAAKLIESTLGAPLIVFNELTGGFSGTESALLEVAQAGSSSAAIGFTAIATWVCDRLTASRSRPDEPSAGPPPHHCRDYFGLRLVLYISRTGCRHVVSVQSASDELWLGRLRQLGVTAREAEVLLWLARGKSNQVIGLILGLSTSTVRTHLRSIFLRLGTETRTAAAAMAWEMRGLIG